MNKVKKIFFISGSRAEFYILRKLFYECTKVFVTKMILHSDNFNFKKEYKKDKLLKNKNIQFLNTNYKKANSTRSLSNSFANQLKKISLLLEKQKPSLVILVGDRSETLAAALAATYNQIPILHIHGGELSFGSIDEKLRHCISKLSSFHLVSHEMYKKRLLQLGENKNNIKVTGSLSLDSISKKKLINKNNFFQRHKKLTKKFLLVSLNSCLYDKDINQISKKLFSILDEYKSIDKVVSYPNSDLHNRHIHREISLRKKRKDYKIFKSLGKDYLDFLRFCDFIIGNSSSGIIEAPYFNKLFLCLGNRQDGRLYSKTSTIKIYETNNIKKNIHKYIKMKKNFKANNLYYKKNSVINSIKFLKKINLSNINFKKFVDLRF